MTPSTQRTRLRSFLVERFAVGLALAALVTFAFVAHQVSGGKTRAVDDAIHRYFVTHQSRALHTVMLGLSLLANGGMLALIAALCLLTLARQPRLRPDALGLLVAVGGGELLITALKLLFHRPRPEAIFAHMGYSFPSGHAFFAITVYGMVAHWRTRGTPTHREVWAAAVLLILSIGFSRIYLGVHYASDVLAGFCVGLPWLWACLALPAILRSAPRKDRSTP